MEQFNKPVEGQYDGHKKRRRLTATCKLRIVLEALESGKAISQ